MAAKARRANTVPKGQGIASSQAVAEVRAAASDGFSKPISALSQLLVMNVLFAIFCLVQALVVKAVVPEFKGLTYFFCLLYFSFLAVSVLDYVIHRFIPDTLISENPSSDA